MSSGAGTQASSMKTPRWHTVEGVALVGFLGALLVAGTYVALVVSYEYGEDHPFGIPKDLQKLVAAAYAPTVLSSIAGFRDSLAGLVAVGDQKRGPPKVTPIVRGAQYLYGALLGGVVAALGGMLFIAAGAASSLCDKALAVTALAWSGSVGYVFDKFLRR